MWWNAPALRRSRRFCCGRMAERGDAWGPDGLPADRRCAGACLVSARAPDQLPPPAALDDMAAARGPCVRKDVRGADASPDTGSMRTGMAVLPVGLCVMQHQDTLASRTELRVKTWFRAFIRAVRFLFPLLQAGFLSNRPPNSSCRAVAGVFE